MHGLALVVIDEAGDPAVLVEALMEPHNESDDGESGWWDWYQIGGRWTGHLTGYDPSADPANIEKCDLCRGTGVRRDMTVANGCNGCAGRGHRAKWPTNWKAHYGDVAALSAVTDWADSLAVVGPQGHVAKWEAHPGEEYEPLTADAYAEAVKAWAENLPERGRVVVVDFHS